MASEYDKYMVQNLAYVLKLTRVNRHLSLLQAHDLTGLHENAISRIESRAHEARLSTYTKVIDGYGLPYEMLFKKYNTLPTREMWRALDARAKQAGHDKRRKPHRKRRRRRLKD